MLRRESSTFLRRPLNSGVPVGSARRRTRSHPGCVRDLRSSRAVHDEPAPSLDAGRRALDSRIASFTSFTPYGGPSNGLQGGELDITVTLFPAGGAPHTGIPITVSCLVGTPPSGAEEGTTVDGFTEKTGSETLIHLTS